MIYVKIEELAEEYLQELLIRTLNPLYSITNRVDKTVRKTTVWCLYVVGFLYFIVSRSPLLRGKFFVGLLHPVATRHALGMVMLLLIAVLSIDAPLHKVKWRRSVILSQLLMGIGIVAISYIHPIGDGYRLFGFQLILIFPCLYLVWNNRADYYDLIRPIPYSIIISGMLFCAGTLRFALKGRLVMDGVRCAGIMSNANVFSLVGLEMVLCGIYLLTTERTSWWKTVMISSAIGLGIGVIVLGQMRIAIIAVLTCSIVTLYYCLRHLNRKATKKSLLHAVFGLVLVILLAEATTYLDNINQAAIEKKNQVVTEAVEGAAEPAGDTGSGTNENVDMLIDRFKSSDDADLSSYSSGRIRIWRNFANELNWLGHSYDKGDAVALTGVPSLPYAHNIFLEIAYRCGTPVGIISMVYYLICGIICIGFLFRKDDNKQPFLIFPIICTITFALEALLDCAVLPFFQVEALLFYISVALVIDKGQK